MSFDDRSFTVYALRCANGRVDAHMLTRRSVWKLCIVDQERMDQKPCGPHALLSAVVSRTAWTVAVEPAATAEETLKIRALAEQCPKCGAALGKDCENLVERKRGSVVFTSWPHTERLILVEQF